MSYTPNNITDLIEGVRNENVQSIGAIITYINRFELESIEMEAYETDTYRTDYIFNQYNEQRKTKITQTM